MMTFEQNTGCIDSITVQEISPLIKENSACAAIAQANLYNNDLPARSKFILLTKLHDVTLVLIEIQYLYNMYLDVKAHEKYYFKTQVIC